VRTVLVSLYAYLRPPRSQRRRREDLTQRVFLRPCWNIMRFAKSTKHVAAPIILLAALITMSRMRVTETAHRSGALRCARVPRSCGGEERYEREPVDR